MHPTGFDASRGGCPCCFIVPPHMLQRLAASGDAGLAETAGRTLRLTWPSAPSLARGRLRRPRLSARAAAARSSIARAPPTCRAIPSARKPIPNPAGTRPRTKPSTMPAPPGTSTIRYLDANPSTIMGKRWSRRSITARNTTMRSGPVSRWLWRRRRCDFPAFHHRAGRHRA